MIITLCGSTRFEKAYHYWNLKLSLDGHIVISCTQLPSNHGGNKDWYDAATKTTLDLIHKKKIEISDAILVIDQDVDASPAASYIGESTQSEIEFASVCTGVMIYYSSAVSAGRRIGLSVIPSAQLMLKV